MSNARTGPVRGRALRLESLEERTLLAIDWTVLQQGLAGTGGYSPYFSVLQDKLDPAFETPIPLVGALGGLHESKLLGDLQARMAALPSLSGTAEEVRSAIEGHLKHAYPDATVTTNSITNVDPPATSGTSFTMHVTAPMQNQVPLDLGLGKDAFMAAWLPDRASMKVDLAVNWDYSVSFQVEDMPDGQGPDRFSFVEVDGSNDLTVTVNAGLTDYTGYGRVGVFHAKMEQTGGARLHATYAVDVTDGEPTVGFATIADTTPLTFDIHASLLPEELFGVNEIVGQLVDPRVFASVSMDYRNVAGDPTSSDFLGGMTVSFNDVGLDFARLYNNVFRPIVADVVSAVRPIRKFADAMLAPLPLGTLMSVVQPGLKNPCVLDIPAFVNDLTRNLPDGPLVDDSVLETFAQAKRTAQWIQEVTSLEGYFGDLTLEDLERAAQGFGYFGGFRGSYDGSKFRWLPLSGGNALSTFEGYCDNLAQITPTLKKGLAMLRGQPAPAQNADQNQRNADLQIGFPLISPSTIFGLLQGNGEGDLFTINATIAAEMPLGDGFTFPIIPPWLSASIAPEIGAGLNFGAGYDAFGFSQVTTRLEEDVDAYLQEHSTDAAWAGLTAFAQARYDASQRKARYLSPLTDGFFLDDHNPGMVPDNSGDADDPTNQRDAPEAWFTFDLNLSAFGGVDLGVLKAGVTLTVSPSATIGVDLNDLPDRGADGAFPQDPSLWTYDGKVRPYELERIWDVDPLGLVNGVIEFGIGISVGLKIQLSLPFVGTITLVDKSFDIADISIWRKPLDVDDSVMVQGEPQREPLFAAMSTEPGREKELCLFMDPSLRQYTNEYRTGPDSFNNERFEVHSLGPTDPNDPSQGETLEVYFSENVGEGTTPPFRHQAEFKYVRNIMTVRSDESADDGDDLIVVDSSVRANAAFFGGAGNDTLMYYGSGTATLNGGSGNDVLYGSNGDDTLLGGLGDDRLFGGGGADALYGWYPEGYAGEEDLGEDFLDGGLGTDTLWGGKGDDTYQWSEGYDQFFERSIDEDWRSGEDRILIDGEFERGTDGLPLQGPDGRLIPKSDVILLSAELGAGGIPTGRALVQTSSGSFALDNVEHVSIAAGGGSDVVTLQNLRFATDVRGVDIDLADPTEYQTGDRDVDTVIYSGRDGQIDRIALSSEAGESTSTDLTNMSEGTVQTSVVRLSDTSGFHDMEVTIVNSDPANDILLVDGRSGGDWLRILESPETALPVPSLIHVILVGGEEAAGQEGDTLETFYLVSPDLRTPGKVEFYGGSRSRLGIWGTPVDDGATNTLIITGSQRSTADARLVVTDQGVDVERDLGIFGIMLGEFDYYSVDDFQLNLGLAPVNNTVQIASAISGDVTIHDGPGNDQFVVESLPANGDTTIVLDGGGTNTVTLGRGGSVDSVKQLEVFGGPGLDTLVYDSSGETVPIDIEEVDHDLGNGQYYIEGTKNSIAYSSGLVSYDRDINEVFLRLGEGDDRAVVPNLGRRVQDNGRGGRIRVDGGAGVDELIATVPDNGEPGGQGVSTSGVETVTFTNTTSQDAPRSWSLSQQELWFGNETVLETHGAKTTSINLGDGADDLYVVSVLPDEGDVRINLGGGADYVDIGPALADIGAPLILDAGPPGSGDWIVIRSETPLGSNPTLSGILTSTTLTGCGMSAAARIEHLGFTKSLGLVLTGAATYDLTIEDTSLPTHVTLPSGGGNTVTVRRPLFDLDLHAGGKPFIDLDDRLVVAPARGMEPIVASIEEPASGMARIGISSPTLASVGFEGFELLDVQLGEESDQFDVNFVPRFLSISSLSTSIEGNGGDDRVTICGPGAHVDFTPGTGQDTLTVEATDPLADDYSQVTFATGLEQFVLDDQRAVTVPIEWIVSPAGLSAVGRAEPLVGLQNADEILLKAGSADDIARVEEQSDQPVRAVVDGNRVEFVEPRPYSVCFDVPLAELRLLTGAGADVVSLVHPAPAQRVQVDTAGGEDRVVVLRLSEGETEVNTGPGADRVEIRSPESYGTLTVNTGDDGDQIDVMQIGLSSSTTLDAGAGNDDIRVLGYRLRSNVSIQGGPPEGWPNDALVFEAGSGFFAGSRTVPDGDVRLEGNSFGVAYLGIENLQLQNGEVLTAAGTVIEEGNQIEAGALRATANPLLPDTDFTWDLNADGDFADATGPTPAVTWEQLKDLDIDDDGVYDVAVRLTDGTVVSQAAAILTITNVAPVSRCSVPPPPPSDPFSLGDTVVLLLGATDPGDDRISRWEVNWRDGSVESFPGDLESASHVYQSKGWYQIHLTAGDEDPDGPYAMTPDLTVNVDAPPPMAGITEYTVSEGGTLRLNGRAAGAPAEWAWDIDGDGDYADAFGKSPALSWSALEALGIRDGDADSDGPGDALYHARLRVTYPDGYQTFSQTPVPIYVRNRAPTAALSNSGPVYEGQSVELTLRNLWDSSSADRLAGFTWRVGDGRPDEVPAGDLWSMEFTPTHSPVQRVTGTLRDKDGGQTLVFTDVAVIDVPPTLTLAGDGEVDEDSAYTLSWSADDPGDDVISQWTIDWGDGRTDAVAGSSPTLEHMFVDEGEYTITVTATDGDGSYSAVKTVTVRPRPTSLMLVGLPSANEGDTYRLFFTPTTPGNELSRWHIDWGDGTYENIERNAGSLTHRYVNNRSDPYQIAAWAYDAHDPGLPRYLVSRVYTLPGPLYGDLQSAGICYLASAARGDFATVAAWAEAQGGYLASVNRAEEEARLIQSFILQDGSIFWIGLRQEDSPAAPIPAPQSLWANWDAAGPGDMPGAWLASGGNAAWVWSPTEPAPVQTSAAPTNRQLSRAFRFNLDLDPNQPVTNSFGAAYPDFGADDSIAAADASFGLWLRPSNLTGKEVLFEAGSETGTSLRLDGDQLIFRVCGATGAQQRASVLEARTTLTGAEIDDYLHVAATIGLGAGHADRISLYVNGQLRATAVAPGAGLTRWADADGCGLGGPAGEMGGNSAGDMDGFDTFEGWIAQVRLYAAELTPAEVLDEFLSVATGNALQWESGESVSYVDFAGSQPAPDAEYFVLAGLGGGMAGWDEAPAPLPPAGLYGIVELDGLWRLAGRQLTSLGVTVRDVAPRVAPNGPAQIDEGDLFNLTIGAPIDPGSDPVSEYRIYWGDGPDPQVIAFPTASSPVSSMNLLHRYADDGTYPINVVIVNGDGVFANPQVLTAEVANVVPTITVSGPQVAEEGLPYTLTLGPVVDPGDDATTVRVDWGDGHFTDCTAPGPATHVYPRGPMQHQIRVELWEEGVYSGAVERSVTVLDVPPRIQLIAPASVQEGVPLELRFGAVTDPGGDPVPPIRGYIVDWGDGNWQKLTAPVSLRHTYADGDSSRNILVHLVTDTGTIVAAGRAPVLVRNAPPQLSDVAITPANSQNEVTLSGRFYDPGINDSLELVIDWGEGALERIAYAAGTTSFTRTHRYLGTRPVYRVHLALADGDGGSDAEDATVTGAMAPLPPGTLDPTFDQDGKLISDLAPGYWGGAYDVAIQPDGKIVAAGSLISDGDPRGSDFALARYYPDGSPDPYFGNAGLVKIDLGSTEDYAYSLAILSGGKILVAGKTGSGPYRVALARLETDGELDLSFGPQHTGIVVLDSLELGDILSTTTLVGMALQPSDGKILVTGRYPRGPIGSPPTWDSDFAVVRLNPDGSVDSTFGQSGLVTVGFGVGADEYANAEATDVAVQPNGRIVVFGTAKGQFALAGLLGQNGALDQSFGNGGGTFITDLTPESAQGLRMAVDADGRIVAAGLGYPADSGPAYALLARYTADGPLDASFGAQGGTVVVPFEGPASGAVDVGIQADGKIVVSGFEHFGGGVTGLDFAAARYESDGTLDLGFGEGGVVTIDFASRDDLGAAVALQPDNCIVLAGSCYASPDDFGSKFAIARLVGGHRYIPGDLDPTFGSGGKLITDFESVFGDGGDGGATAVDVAIQPDGKIVAAGFYFSAPGNSDLALARHLPSGELDPSFGTQGRVYTDFGGSIDSALAVAILPDGKILVSGRGGPAENPGVVLARYTADGGLDRTFGGGDGFVIEAFGELQYPGSLGLAVADDGTIYVPIAAPMSGDWVVVPGIASFHSDGTRNTDFGNDGVVMFDLPIYPQLISGPADLALDRDGNLLLLCQPKTTDDYRYYFATAKYDLARGGLDPEFGAGGWAFTGFEEFQDATTYPFRLAIDRESGRIIVAGYAYGSLFWGQSFAVACYTPDGQLDPSFGDQGKVVPDLTEFGLYDGTATDVAIQSDGKVVVSGFTRSDPYAGDAFSALRLNANGEIDTTFGDGGIVTIKFNRYSDFGTALAIQSDNSIVLAGVTYNEPSSGWLSFGNDPDFAVARLLGSPLPPPAVKKVTLSSDRKSLVIQLNDSDLDPALATNPANFRLTAARSDANRDGNHFGDADDQVWTINSDCITYDPATDQITLRFATQMNDRFRLQIDGDDSTGDGMPGLLSRAGSFFSGGDYTKDLDLRTTLVFTARCPVDLEVTDGSGRVVSKTLNEIPGATYLEADLDGDGDLDDQITVPDPGSEDYSVRVVPEPGADPAATVTLVVEDAATTTVLLGEVPIGALGPDPEPIPVTVDRTPPAITVAADPGVLQPAESWVPVHVTVQAQDETDTHPQAVLVDITPSWETDPAAVIYGAEYGQSDDQFSLKAERGQDHRYYTLTYAAADASGNIAYATAIVAVGNSQPVAMPGEDLTAEEGQAVSFDGTASTDADGDALSYFWDFGDGTTTTGVTASHVYADDGVYTVTLTVDDRYYGGQHSGSLLVTVSNAAPIVGPIVGPDCGVRGQELRFSGSFEDPGILDQHTATWQVFNGTALVADGSGLDFAFTPTTVGSYTVSLTVSDADGGSGSQSRVVAVEAIGVQTEPGDPTKVALVVGGTTGNDSILVTPGPFPGQYLVWVNCLSPDCVAVPEGTSFGRIVIYGQAGNDDIQVDGSIGLAAWLFGGAGNDRLKGGAGHDVVLGGEGDDLLVGGSGRDLLIGGMGTDRIVGNADDDILISGFTLYDEDQAALSAMRDEWTRIDTGYETRIGILANQAAAVHLNVDTVFGDLDRDVLTGSSGLDWFLFDQERDRATDLKDEVFMNDLDFIGTQF